MKKRSIAAALVILVLMPLTIAFGMTYLQDRKYYFISLLMILYISALFFVSFEGRKPRAREIVVIATLAAIAVAGRMAAYIVPQVKPMLALVIIAGAAFGAESGFLVGAVSAFVSNFFFGQGPWTPWQMFAFGIIGFVSGIMFYSLKLSKKPIPISIFGFVAAIVLYGGIMNPSAVLMGQAEVSFGAIIAAYAAGFVYDLIHAAATAVFLMILSKPMFEKLDRIKIKYGLLK